MPTRDDVWIKAATGRLAAALGDDSLGGGHSYSTEECAALAELLHDMSLDRVDVDMSPSQRILYALLRLQPGIGDAEALIAASVLGRVNLGRLVLSSRAAAEVIDINEVTLLRHREEGHIAPALEHRSQSGRRYGVSYWLHEILYILAHLRQHPPSGGPHIAWPEDLRVQ